jgi:hypothetical protein
MKMATRVIVVNRTEKGVGLAQVVLEGKTWVWARTEPDFVRSVDQVPDTMMELPWAEWDPRHQVSDLNISLLFRLVTHHAPSSLEDAIKQAGFFYLGDSKKPSDEAYNQAHMLAGLLNRELT